MNFIPFPISSYILPVPQVPLLSPPKITVSAIHHLLRNCLICSCKKWSNFHFLPHLLFRIKPLHEPQTAVYLQRQHFLSKQKSSSKINKSLWLKVFLGYFENRGRLSILFTNDLLFQLLSCNEE